MNQKFLQGILLVAIGSILFSTKAVIVKYFYINEYHVTAEQLLLLRMMFSVPIFTIVYVFRQKSKRESLWLTRQQYLKILILGSTGYYLANYLDFKGLETVSASLERIILFSYPSTVLILNALFFKKRIQTPQLVAIIIAYTGVCCTIYFGQSDQEINHSFSGIIYIILSTLVFSGYLIGVGKMSKSLGSVRFTSHIMIVAGLAALLAYVSLSSESIFLIHEDVVWGCLLMAVLSTVLPAYLVYHGFSLIGSGNGAIVSTIGPISTILLSILFLGESPSFIQFGGTILVFLAILYLSLKGKSEN